MERNKLKHKLDKQFLKFCSRCKVYYPSRTRICPVCRKTLTSYFLKYYLMTSFKRALFVLFILLLCVCVTFGIQKNERAKYANGVNLLINKKFPEGWKEIKGALFLNPLYKYVKPLTGQSNEKKPEPQENKPEIKKFRPELKRNEYILQEIYFDASGKNSAMINDKVIFEGDSLGNFKIIKINRDSIDIETQGKQENKKFGRIWK